MIMAIIDPLIISNRDKILQTAEKHGGRNLRVFGSRGRGDSMRDSDVDLLVSMEKGRSLLDLIAIQVDLEELLGCKVDITTEAGLSPYIKDNVLKEAQPL